MKPLNNLIAVMACVVLWSTACYPATQTFDPTHAVIHHTLSHDVSIETVRKWHVNENGWNNVGYHFLIRASGKVESGRPVGFTGAHAKGRNHYIGVALTGYDDFSAEQLESLLNLLISLDVKYIERHRDSTQNNPCPGLGIPVERIQETITLIYESKIAD